MAIDKEGILKRAAKYFRGMKKYKGKGPKPYRGSRRKRHFDVNRRAKKGVKRRPAKKEEVVAEAEAGRLQRDSREAEAEKPKLNLFEMFHGKSRPKSVEHLAKPWSGSVASKVKDIPVQEAETSKQVSKRDRGKFVGRPFNVTKSTGRSAGGRKERAARTAAAAEAAESPQTPESRTDRQATRVPKSKPKEPESEIPIGERPALSSSKKPKRLRGKTGRYPPKNVTKSTGRSAGGKKERAARSAAAASAERKERESLKAAIAEDKRKEEEEDAIQDSLRSQGFNLDRRSGRGWR